MYCYKFTTEEAFLDLAAAEGLVNNGQGVIFAAELHMIAEYITYPISGGDFDG